MNRGPSYSDLCRDLNERVDLVIDRYCSVQGAYRDTAGRFFCLNPMRADRRVGSFWIETRGPKIGHWQDKATGEFGDAMDMVRSIHSCGVADGAQIVKSLLGLVDMSPRAQRQYEAQQRRLAEKRAAQARTDAEDKEKRCRRAQAIWMNAGADVRNTPVDRYLRGRSIDISILQRWPSAIRFLPDCYYRRDDPETGEIFEAKWPAMVSAISGADGRFLGMHRTYLAEHADGRVIKADVPDAKKIYGAHHGGLIRIWTGKGPRGGKGVRLAECPPDTRVYITEGVEDALSLVMFRPEYRVVASITLGNMAHTPLPKNVTSVVLCADNDPGAQAQEQFDAAIRFHREAGRDVRVWRNTWGGKDLNDALRLVAAGQGADHAA